MPSPSKSDLISIGLPVYNGEKYIGKAIESVLKQSHGDLELIISDNGSTDHTLDVINAYAASDNRIKILRRTSVDKDNNNWRSFTSKAYENFQRVLLQASGSNFAWLSHDNFWHRDFLSETRKQIGKGAGAIGSIAMYDHLTGTITDLPGIPEISPSINKIDQLRVFVSNRRLGTAAAIYGVFKREALLAVAPKILSGRPFDWLDLYLVSRLIARHGFTVFSTKEPLLYFGCEGTYIEKPVNGVATCDDIMLRKVQALKFKILAREAFTHPRFVLSQEIGKRLYRVLPLRQDPEADLRL
jgi:glycosyltransferase involved in cell wall biosynthesis